MDTKTLQAAQWNISIFVMWSFSCRADKTKDQTVFRPRLSGRKDTVIRHKLFTLKYTIFYGSATLTPFIQHDFL